MRQSRRTSLVLVPYIASVSDEGARFLSGLVHSATGRLPMPNTGRVFFREYLVEGCFFENMSINFGTPYVFVKNERREAIRSTSVRNESAFTGV